MMKRRNFLGFLAASPFAAKQAAESAAANLTNVDASGLNKSGLVGGGSMPGGVGTEASALRRLLATVGIPDWKTEEMRDNAQYVSHLDADIAALRSVSRQAKLQCSANVIFSVTNGSLCARG